MRSGVTITTESQRDGRTKVLTAPTLPCRMNQVPTLNQPAECITVPVPLRTLFGIH